MKKNIKINKLDHFKTSIIIRIEEDEVFSRDISSFNKRKSLNNILQNIINDNNDIIKYQKIKNNF